MYKKHHLFLAVTTIIAGASSLPSFANDFAIEEIVVTAQRRAESLQDVPIAITAFNEKMMKEAGITGIDNVAQFTPGFTLSSYNKVTPQPFIRGIGTNASGAGDDASVAVFIDEVYISRAGAYDSNLFDLERVEVLRGPQGTLYGKNVVGGALNITTRRPSEEFEAKVNISAGNYDAGGLQTYVSGPLSETVRAKLALASGQRDGLVKNTFTGSDLRDEDNLSARAGLLWEVDDSTEVYWAIDASRDRESGVGRVLAGEPLAGVAAWSPSLNDRDNTDSLVDGYTDRDVWGTSLRITSEQSYGTWTSVTGYRSTDYQFLDELVPVLSAHSLLMNYVDEEETQFSQELRLASSNDSSPFEWTVGAYYFHDDIERIEEWDTQGFAELFGYPYPTGFRSHSDAENLTSSAALFGQVSYNLAEEWRFTVGGRYTEETKEFDISTSGLEPLFGFLTENYTVESEETWDDFSGKLSIDYMGFDNILLYLSVGEGFKSGAFNSLAPDADQAAQSIDPELAMQVELGVKSQWLDDRVRLNAVVFSIDYQDLQVFQTTDDQRIIVTNAGQATSQGVELELIAKPLEGLDISASYSYLDATYDEYTTSGSDYSGNRLQRAPKNTYSISASYLMPLTDLGELAFRVDYLSQNKVYFNPSNAALQVDEGYELVNARVAFEPEEGNWELALWGKNLSDEQYAVFKNDLSFIGTNSTADILGDPRTYGVSFTWNM